MTFDAIAPGDVAWVAEKSKNENLDTREIYTQKPYYDPRARVETLLCSEYYYNIILIAIVYQKYQEFIAAYCYIRVWSTSNNAKVMNKLFCW